MVLGCLFENEGRLHAEDNSVVRFERHGLSVLHNHTIDSNELNSFFAKRLKGSSLICGLEDGMLLLDRDTSKDHKGTLAEILVFATNRSFRVLG